MSANETTGPARSSHVDDAEDDALLAEIADGDIAALEQLYRRLRVPVFAVALAVAGDRALAEDVLQDTFVRVFERARRYEPRGRARAWVTVLARNLALDACRRRSRERPDPPERALEPPAGERLDLVASLLRLEPLARQIVVLHDLGDLTHREIAAQLGIPEGTVRWRYRLALDSLKELLADG